MVKGIIFDFDDTLVNSLETYWQVFNTVAWKLGLPAPRRDEVAMWLKEGLGLCDIISSIYPDLDREAVTDCAQKMRDVSREVMREYPITAKPGVKEILQSLKSRGVKIGLVTGRVLPSERVWSELAELGLAQFFNAVVTANDHPRKPAPDGIIACLKQLDLRAKEAVFVGDARSDLIAGKRAGVRVVVVNDGDISGGISGPEQPDMMIDDLAKLVELLGKET